MQTHFDVDIGHYDTFAEFATRFYGHLRDTGRVFLRGDSTITMVDPASGPRRILTVDDFLVMASDCLDLRVARGRADVPARLNRQDAVSLMGSSARLELPEIDFVITDPATITINGRVECITEPGYHAIARTYYWRKLNSPQITVRDSTRHLERCFSGVPFRSEEYRNNILAWLVAGISLDEGVNGPMLCVTGNDRGVGKSSLVQACGYLLTGQHQNGIRPSGSEFEKQLGAKFASEERFIVLDNVVSGVGSFSQPALARLLTEGRSKAVRLLGHSRQISQTGVLFAMTMNDCKLDQDLATRSLPVALYRERPGPMSPYVLRYAQEHRAEIFGELLGLAFRRDPAFQIPEDYSTCRFVDWIDYVAPIIMPRFGDLAIQEAADLDDRLQDLFDWGYDRIGRPFTAKDLYEEILGNPESFSGLNPYILTSRSERGRLRRIGWFLANNTDRSYSPAPRTWVTLKEASPGGAGNRRHYIFKESS